MFVNFSETARSLFFIESTLKPVEYTVKSWNIHECLVPLGNVKKFMDLSRLSYFGIS